MASSIPFQWPGVWKDPGALSLLSGSPINCDLVPRGNEFGPITERARQAGLQVADAASPPSGVTVVDGLWPGVKLSESGEVDRADAGPTGEPWVDSNGWKIRLTSALHPGAAVWVNAAPKGSRLPAEAYKVAIADAVAHGMGNLGGLAAKGTSTGYTLDPGEIKIFGHDKDTSTATDFVMI